MFKSHLAPASPAALTTESPEFLNVLWKEPAVVVALTGTLQLQITGGKKRTSGSSETPQSEDICPHKPNSKVPHVLREVNIVNQRHEVRVKDTRG